MQELIYSFCKSRIPRSVPSRADSDALFEIPRTKKKLQLELEKLAAKIPSSPSKPKPSIKDPPKSAPKPEPEPAPKPASKPAPGLAPKPAPQPAPKPTLQPEPKPAPRPQQDPQVEAAALQKQLEVVYTLIAQRNWWQAEGIARTVKNRSKELFGKDYWLTQSSQKLLCVALRSQGTRAKLDEVQDLCWEVWNHPSSASLAQNGNRWVLENGFGLGQVYEQKGLLPQAEEQYEKLWKLMPEAAFQLATLLVKRNEADFSMARHALKKSFKSDDSEIRKAAMKLSFEVGQSLYEQGKYAEAEEPILMAWTESKKHQSEISSSAFSGGWRLSNIYYSQKKYDQAKLFLEALQNAQIAGPRTSPTNSQIDGLLAWVYRQRGELTKAENLAKSVWEREEDKDILGPSLSTGANYIWLLSNRGKSQNAEKARKRKVVWERVVSMKKAREASCTLEDLKITVRCWRNLADDVEKFIRQQGFSEWAAATRIRHEAKELEKRYRGRTP
jgi:tetratricopeptide (TPR) repeat protein